MVNGWIPTSLGDILTQERRPVALDPEKKYAEIGVYSYGRGIFHKEPRTGFEVGNKDLYEIKQGDFIFQITFAWEGAIALASEAENGMYGSVRFPTYRINEDICNPKFLLNYFKTEEGRREVGRISPGSAGRNRVLATKRLPEIKVPLPPLTEQRRIVAHIESLAARVNEAQRLREEATKETKSIMASKSFDVFSEVKKKYSPKTFGSFSPHVTSGPRYWRDRYSKDGFRFYRAQDIGPHGNILHDNKAYVTPPESDQGKTALLSVGDLMIVITGATVGRVSVFTDDLEPGYVSQHVSICRLPQEQIVPRYALWWLLSPDGQSQLLGQRYGQGKPGLNLTNIRSIEIPVPPLDEQRRIVAYLDGLQAKVNALRGLQVKGGEELSALMASVLDRAFKGEL